MNPHSLYELVRAEHQALVARGERTLNRPSGRRRWWHAVWRPPHAQERTVLATVPAPLLLR